jgi:hypothetical protein
MATLLLPPAALAEWMEERDRTAPGETLTARRAAAATAFGVSADAVRRRMAQLEAIA